MPTIELMIHGNTHAVSCNDGEEERIRLLADKFNTKLKQVAASLDKTDDKTLYLIATLILLDEADQPISTEDSELFETISNKIFSIKKLLSVE
jgi:cell division protein ZapA (FtsZ GTPase activity inhibitor)